MPKDSSTVATCVISFSKINVSPQGSSSPFLSSATCGVCSAQQLWWKSMEGRLFSTLCVTRSQSIHHFFSIPELVGSWSIFPSLDNRVPGISHQMWYHL